MDKDFDIKLEGTTLTVELKNELTKRNASNLQQLLSDYLGRDIQRIVFDATDLVFISSSGVRVIIFARQKLGDKPEIVFVNCPLYIT
jgi:anti-anti-sigma factor